MKKVVIAIGVLVLVGLIFLAIGGYLSLKPTGETVEVIDEEIEEVKDEGGLKLTRTYTGFAAGIDSDTYEKTSEVCNRNEQDVKAVAYFIDKNEVSEVEISELAQEVKAKYGKKQAFLGVEECREFGFEYKKGGAKKDYVIEFEVSAK
tara:strand:- start:5 stop:448 length:444 start_codon:yes stop_codon:yes gene_type:complete